MASLTNITNYHVAVGVGGSRTHRLAKGSETEELGINTPSTADTDSEEIPLANLKNNSQTQSDLTAEDNWLSKILSLSIDPSVHIRLKALSYLTSIVDGNPPALGRQDIQLWVRNALLDPSRQVREVAVSLISKHMWTCAGILEKYCEMLSARILDVGVGVRKRVIRTLRDICLKCPEFPKVPELCIKIVKRMNDEEITVRKLVVDTFQEMWFSSSSKTSVKQLRQTATHFIGFVEATTTDKLAADSLEFLLQKIFDQNHDVDMKDRQKPKQAFQASLSAAENVVDCVVDQLLRAEEIRLVSYFSSCISTLLLFAKTCPQILAKHVSVLQEYLTWKCQGTEDVLAVTHIAKILALVVPLLRHPSESQLTQIEENCVKLMFKNDKSLIEACTLCLAAVVNRMTRNYELIRDLFRRYRSFLSKQVGFRKEYPTDPSLATSLPLLRRSVYTIGLFLRYFDFTSPEVHGALTSAVPKAVFEDLLFLLEETRPIIVTRESHTDTDNASASSSSTGTAGANIHLSIQNFVLQSIGHICIRHYEYMLHDELKYFYKRFLSRLDTDSRLKIQTLANIQLYLSEESARMRAQDQDFERTATSNQNLNHNIKVLDDVASGMSATIIQTYLAQILEAYLHQESGVRLKAANVIQLIVQQGLVNPVQILPTLIAMSTDTMPAVTGVANNLLQEIHLRHPQFLQSQAMNGFKLSIQLQKRILGLSLARGHRVQEAKPESANVSAVALNGYVYSLFRTSKQARRAIAMTLLKQFDDQQIKGQDVNLSALLYVADNLAHFPYVVLDEPLFILHHLEISLSVLGSNLLQAFEESLLLAPTDKSTPAQNQNGGEDKKTDRDNDDDDCQDPEALLARLPPAEIQTHFQEFRDGYHSCLLMLLLKWHLKECYGITDKRLIGYCPSDTNKTHDKPLNKKRKIVFQPKSTLAALECSASPRNDSPEERRELVEQYLLLKDLMLQLDRDNEDDYEENEGGHKEQGNKGRKRPRPVKNKGSKKRKPHKKRTRSSSSSSEEEDEDSSNPDYQ